VDVRTGDELSELVLIFAAERAAEYFILILVIVSAR